jgi:hypothetical protein
MEKQGSTISFIGIAIGAMALLLAILHFWAGPFSPQPTLEQTVAEKAVSIKEATIAALKGEKPKAKSEEPVAPVKRSSIDMDHVASLATAVLGGLAVILGVVGYATKEPLRAAGGAALLGGSAIAFQFAVLALGAIFLAILVVGVLSQIGID